MRNQVFLIIDDDEDWLFLLERILNDEGYSVMTANSCSAAMEIVEQVHPQCVISDIKLGQGNGLHICNNIKASSKLRDIPVIMLSGNAEPPYKCACDAFVCKAEGTDRLMHIIKGILSKAKP